MQSGPGIISKVVISTALGPDGRGIFPYTLLPGYRRLLRAVRDTGAAVLTPTALGMLADVYRILCYHFGEPPTSFTWRTRDKDDKLSEPKTWTPQTLGTRWNPTLTRLHQRSGRMRHSGACSLRLDTSALRTL